MKSSINDPYSGPERRRIERRHGGDRRMAIRWEPNKADRRAHGITADRRGGSVWNQARV